MAERLTKKITKTIQDKYSLGSYLYYDFNGVENTNRLLNKLGELEDIMERLGINFVEDLEDEVRSLRVDKYIYKKEQDTWKRACELACDVILRFTDGCPCKADYFYQQAKKEGENNDTNN